MKRRTQFRVRRSAPLLCAQAVLLGACASATPGANVVIDWSQVSGLSAADQASIQQIAAELTPYRQISLTDDSRGLPDERVLIATTPQGNRGAFVAWEEFHLCHISGARCTSSTKWGVGNWRVLEEASVQERWRIFDGNWSVDVKLGGAVSYAEAETLILAIHRNQMTKDPSLQQYFANMPSLEGSNVSIRAIDPLAHEFNVIIGSGLTTYDMHFRINGIEVEFYYVSVATASIAPPRPVVAALTHLGIP